jgi:hypothetical protein
MVILLKLALGRFSLRIAMFVLSILDSAND